MTKLNQLFFHSSYLISHIEMNESKEWHHDKEDRYYYSCAGSRAASSSSSPGM